MGYIQAAQLGRQVEQPKESTLDKIYKGVQLANMIVSSVDTVQDMGTKKETAKTNLDTAKINNAIAKDKSEGFISAEDLLNYDQSATALPNYQKAMTRRGGVPEEIYISKRAEGMTPYQQEQINLQKKELGIKELLARQDAKSNKSEFSNLPVENQEVIKDLSKKNASKIAIANQIDAFMEGWDDLPEDQKVAQGRQMLKVLNSSEGADAIGSEEAKRLGSKLEFAMGNMFNSNPTQFGRDLPGFKEQALGTSKSLRNAIAANEGEIGKRYGRNAGLSDLLKNPENKTMTASASPPAPKVGMQEGGHVFLGGDPSNPSSWKKLDSSPMSIAEAQLKKKSGNAR